MKVNERSMKISEINGGGLLKINEIDEINKINESTMNRTCVLLKNN